MATTLRDIFSRDAGSERRRDPEDPEDPGDPGDDSPPEDPVMTPREQALLDSLQSKAGYRPRYDIVAPDSLRDSGIKGLVLPEKEKIALEPAKSQGKYGGWTLSRGSGQVLSHEISHLLHTGRVPRDSLRAIFERKAREKGAPADSARALRRLTEFDDPEETPYRERSQERFAYRAQDALRRAAGVRRDTTNHPTAEAFEAGLMEIMRRKPQSERDRSR